MRMTSRPELRLPFTSRDSRYRATVKARGRARDLAAKCRSVQVARSKSSAGSILASGRDLPSGVSLERETKTLPELGHLPPEVDKRDESFIERATADGRMASPLTSDVSPLSALTSEDWRVKGTERQRKREKRRCSFFPLTSLRPALILDAA